MGGERGTQDKQASWSIISNIILLQLSQLKQFVIKKWYYQHRGYERGKAGGRERRREREGEREQQRLIELISWSGTDIDIFIKFLRDNRT